MEEKYDEIIKKHYDNIATEFGESPISTMGDMYVREMETKFIIDIVKKYVSENKKDTKVLDVGCGNGYTLQCIKNEFDCVSLYGIENNLNLLSIAQKRLNGSEVVLSHGDIRDNEIFQKEKYDIVISQRVIINLLNSDDQKQSVGNIASSLTNNGVAIFIESFMSGLKNLNSAREEFGLTPINPSHYNLYLNEDVFDNSSLERVKWVDENFFSTHYFVSRALHPAILEATNKEFKRNSHFVSFLTNAFPSGIGTYSPLKFFVFKKTESTVG